MSKIICIGDVPEDDLGLVKDFFEKYGKIISRKSFEEYLQLSAGQHALFEKGENPFSGKAARFFDGPYFDRDIPIEGVFQINDALGDVLYNGNITTNAMCKYYFPQEMYSGEISVARLQIVKIRETSGTIKEICELANKEVKKRKNLSKFTVRTLHTIIKKNISALAPFAGSTILIPYVSKKLWLSNEKHTSPPALFLKIEKDFKTSWFYELSETPLDLEETYVALLTQ